MAELIPIPFDKLLKRIYYEYRQNNAVFDLPAKKFYRPNPELDLSVSFCGNKAANPVGPAAGPHTQLAQNIVLAWLAGSRMLELKTVQIKDDLQLTRPCIDMATVGYNTEWSQELKLDESLREYVKAWMILELLQQSFDGAGFHFEGKPEGSGLNLDTVFDVSVGYDLAGIQSPPIRHWLTVMRNAGELIEEYRQHIPDEFSAFRDISFRTEIANSITLSTFHGCPADEIERICEFLLIEMDYNVIIKMNPPMLGKARLEHLLYEKMGYTSIEVHQKAYEVNISFADAVDMVQRLQGVAARQKKTLGVKFGNTLEVMNKGAFLKDAVQYLSGQPLHILHLALVEEWRKVFGDEFPISFSAGVDANNFADMVALGIVPVTTCTDLLRPGGYGRLPQYLYNLERTMKTAQATTIPEFIAATHLHNCSSQMIGGNQQAILLQNTSALLNKSILGKRYHAENNSKPPRKIGSHLHLWDCINCDKCIPVCPNDANFFFEVEPLEIEYKNIEITDSGWNEIPGGTFKIEETHQIANFADACNECGNCDVFCPEDGGPYIEKPRFFGSLEAWKRWNTLSGFYLSRNNGTALLYGRFGDKEYQLRNTMQGISHFQTEGIELAIEQTTHTVLSVQNANMRTMLIDMRYYFVMSALSAGMLNTSRVHFVNVE